MPWANTLIMHGKQTHRKALFLAFSCKHNLVGSNVIAYIPGPFFYVFTINCWPFDLGLLSIWWLTAVASASTSAGPKTHFFAAHSSPKSRVKHESAKTYFSAQFISFNPLHPLGSSVNRWSKGKRRKLPRPHQIRESVRIPNSKDQSKFTL
jgi:hypothetical protein